MFSANLSVDEAGKLMGTKPKSNSPTVEKMKVTDLPDDFYKGKIVFVRADLNAPYKNGKINDPLRIDATLPDLRFLIEHGAKLIVGTHRSKPDEPIAPIATRLKEEFGSDNVFFEEGITTTAAAKTMLDRLQNGQLILLDEVRKNPAEKAKAGMPGHSQLASDYFDLVDVYVNAAFGVDHRDHVSVAGAPKEMLRLEGILVTKEKEVARMVRERLAVAYMGGSKVSDKIPTIKALINISTLKYIPIGGAMANAFLAAQGINVGASKGVDEDDVKEARNLLDHKKVIYPKLDVVIANSFSEDAQHKVVTVDDLRNNLVSEMNDGWLIVDIGPKQVRYYASLANEKDLDPEGIIFWNGPMGAFDKLSFAENGTKTVGEAIAQSRLKGVVGGGDSADAVRKFDITGFYHISTGGGAFIKILIDGDLVGIAALSDATISSPLVQENKFEKGGIDMNQIDVDRQGSGVDIQFDPIQLQEMLDMGLTGFTPVIINLTPLPSVLPLLGLEPKREEEFEISSI